MMYVRMHEGINVMFYKDYIHSYDKYVKLFRNYVNINALNLSLYATCKLKIL